MKIEVETKYDIGDEVYGIYADVIRDDANVLKLTWFVEKPQYTHRGDQVQNIEVQKTDRDITIHYLLGSLKFRESDVFKGLQEAEEECKKRNDLGYLWKA